MLEFTLVNSELRNISSDKIALKCLIINILRCQLSFVTFAFTLSFNVLYAFFMQKKFVGFPCLFPQGLDKEPPKIGHSKK